MVLWTFDAVRDIEETWSYIAADNEAAANRIVDRLLAAGVRLSRHPLIGRQGREPGTRELSVSNTRYILIYRQAGEDVEILRALHSARQWPPKG